MDGDPTSEVIAGPAPALTGRPRGPAALDLVQVWVPRALAKEAAARWPELAQAVPEVKALACRRSAQGALRLLLALAVRHFDRLVPAEVAVPVVEKAG